MLLPFSLRPSNLLIVGITSFMDTLTIVAGIKGGENAMHEVDRLLGRMHEELVGVLNSTA